jgi:hypothetical protein
MTLSTKLWLLAVWHICWPWVVVILGAAAFALGLVLAFSVVGCHPPCGPVHDHPAPAPKPPESAPPPPAAGLALTRAAFIPPGQW